MKKEFNVGIPDKVLVNWLEGKDYMVTSDEGEALGVGAGYFIATGKRANVFMSADGFCNALNPLTSYIIPENIEVNIIISFGRQELQHKVMSDILINLVNLIPYDPKRINFEFIKNK